MFNKIVLILFIKMMSSFAMAKEDISHLSFSMDDKIIYQDTKAICHNGDTKSAFSLAFNKENFYASLSEWFKVVSLNISAAENKIKNGGLSDRIKKIRNSRGFWLAMTDCYGYQYGKMNHGLLMKQIVDLGHLVNESTSTLVTVGTAAGAGKLISASMTKYPIVSRFVVSAMLTLQINETVHLIKNLYFTELTEKEKEELEQIKKMAFKDADTAIHFIINKAKVKIDQIDQDLKKSDLTDSDRQLLIQKKEKIVSSLSQLEKIQSQ